MDKISKYVKNALKGDSKAFGQLYEATCRSVYFTCLGFVKKDEDAEDLMQNVYISAFDKLNTLKQPEKFGAWVNRIAVNACRDFITKNGAHPQKSIDDEESFTELVDENILPEEYIENAEKRGIVMDIVTKALSDTLYRTVLMFYFDELTIPEIAEIMNCPEGTVKYRLNAARESQERSAGV